MYILLFLYLQDYIFTVHTGIETINKLAIGKKLTIR